MNAQQLRNSILQEAIEGRLVPQDPNDEPASALLERIREEKRRLVKEGKLKKKDLVETPISEDEKPFEIPESWEWVRLREISSYRRGSFPQPYTDLTSYGGPDSMPFVQVADVEENEYRLKRQTKKTISQKAMPFSVFVPNGTVVVTLQGSIGKVAITQYDSYVDRTLAIFEHIYGHINKLFFSIILKNKFENEALYARGATIKTITKEEFQSFLLPLPPLAEQHRIVAKIEELLPKVEEYGKAQEALDKLNAELPEKLKKSILQEAIEGRLVPQDPNDEPGSVLLDKIRKEKAQLVKEGKLKKKDLVETPISEDEIPFEIPESWEWCRVGTIASVLGGKRIPAGRKLSQENTGHIYIRVSDMKEDTVSTDNLLYVPEDIYPSISKYIINKEDVYITVAGTIGRIGKIPPELDGANLTENADRIVFTNINQDWLIKCLQSNFVQKQITDVTTKVGQPKLAILRIQNLLIPLPPLAEQHRIVAKIEELFAEVEKLAL